jgi:hypothetical protein
MQPNAPIPPEIQGPSGGQPRSERAPRPAISITRETLFKGCQGALAAKLGMTEPALLELVGRAQLPFSVNTADGLRFPCQGPTGMAARRRQPPRLPASPPPAASRRPPENRGYAGDRAEPIT